MADRDHPAELPPGHPRPRQPPQQRRTVEKEIIRCLKRYVARKVYHQLRDGG